MEILKEKEIKRKVKKFKMVDGERGKDRGKVERKEQENILFFFRNIVG